MDAKHRLLLTRRVDTRDDREAQIVHGGKENGRDDEQPAAAARLKQEPPALFRSRAYRFKYPFTVLLGLVLKGGH